ncbi:AAA family ATPase [Aeromonas hydrophila]|uniref:AAA family ATPase n=1 Tax=Aeromonas hydrophila TaxID=644 RepID=UPI0038D09505
MHLHSYRLRNFRRLKCAHIELAKDISIFVGANNSGKTSATQAIHSLLVERIVLTFMILTLRAGTTLSQLEILI